MGGNRSIRRVHPTATQAVSSGDHFTNIKTAREVEDVFGSVESWPMSWWEGFSRRDVIGQAFRSQVDRTTIQFVCKISVILCIPCQKMRLETL